MSSTPSREESSLSASKPKQAFSRPHRVGFNLSASFSAGDFDRPLELAKAIATNANSKTGHHGNGYLSSSFSFSSKTKKSHKDFKTNMALLRLAAMETNSAMALNQASEGFLTTSTKNKDDPNEDTLGGLESPSVSNLKDKDLEELKKAFNKYDKRKTGSIKPNEIVEVFRTAGQNPNNHECARMIELAEQSGTGMLMYDELLPIAEKFWRNYENYIEELKEACLAFDKDDTGLIDFEDLKNILLKYGDQLDEDEIDMFEKVVSPADGKIIVDEFIKLMSPLPEEKKKKGGKKGKGSAAGKKKKK